VSRPTISVALRDLPTKPHVLYRFFDRTDALLYVGVSVDFAKRLGQHRKGKHWWPEVDHITIEHFDNRRDVLAAEKAAIESECPLYNVDHNELVEAGFPTLADARAEGQRDLAFQLMDYLPGEEATERAWADVAQTPYDEMYNGDSIVQAALVAMSQAQERLWKLEDSLRNLIDALPRDEMQQDWKIARADVLSHMGPEIDEFDVFCWMAHVSAKRLRKQRGIEVGH
jgi:hypothetical protein